MDPTLKQNLMQVAIIVVGYLITLTTSGLFVKCFIGRKGKSENPTPEETERTGLGTIIGKCENVLTLTFILSGNVTGLALIFAAKSIVRSEQMKSDPKYYLGGTLLNFTYSVVWAYLILFALKTANYFL